MVKKAIIIAFIAIIILIIVSFIISVVNLKPVTFKSVVTYDTNINVIKEAPSYPRTNGSSNNLAFITNIVKYEKTVMIFASVLVILFILLFYGTKRSKGW